MNVQSFQKEKNEDGTQENEVKQNFQPTNETTNSTQVNDRTVSVMQMMGQDDNQVIKETGNEEGKVLSFGNQVPQLHQYTRIQSSMQTIQIPIMSSFQMSSNPLPLIHIDENNQQSKQTVTTRKYNPPKKEVSNEPEYLMFENDIYNSRGYKICGYLNQHSKPCQRIGKCPFHHGKPRNKLPKNLRIVHSKEEIAKKRQYKRGWSKEEHFRFLNGLQIHGKGAWKEISMIVETRTPIQIQSHAQKFFQRQKKGKKSKKSIHDFTLKDLKELLPSQKMGEQVTFKQGQFLSSPNPPLDLTNFVPYFSAGLEQNQTQQSTPQQQQDTQEQIQQEEVRIQQESMQEGEMQHVQQQQIQDQREINPEVITENQIPSMQQSIQQSISQGMQPGIPQNIQQRMQHGIQHGIEQGMQGIPQVRYMDRVNNQYNPSYEYMQHPQQLPTPTSYQLHMDEVNVDVEERKEAQIVGEKRKRSEIEDISDDIGNPISKKQKQ